MNLYYNENKLQHAVQRSLPIWGDLEGWNAKELDEENGMYYYSARYYAPPTFISRDPMFEKYPSISPYTYCANNPVIMIDEKGLFPKPVLRKNQDGTFSFKPAAAHLLSLVSGVNESIIANTVIQVRAPGQYRPGYNAYKGGGAITMGLTSLTANITYTENYFEDDPTRYNNNGYGQDVMEWLFLSSHEVGHIPQIDEKKGFFGYVTSILAEYCKFGHKDAPMEQEAEYGFEMLTLFNNFINKNYEKGGLEKLLRSNRSQEQIIKIIDKWWGEFIKLNE